jgi:hypothetical protein
MSLISLKKLKIKKKFRILYGQFKGAPKPRFRRILHPPQGEF